MAQSDFERMQELIRLLNQYRHEYFELFAPTVSDEVYDQMMSELRTLQKKLEVYMSDSPAIYPKYRSVDRLEMVQHALPMPIAKSANNMGELVKFQMQKQLILMPALKSVTVKIIYEDTKLQQVITCGDGRWGYDISHNFCSISGIPYIFNHRDRIVIAGEVYMTPADFDHFRANVAKRVRNPYTEISDMIFDAVHLSDSRICRKCNLKFIATEVLEGLDQLQTKAQRLGQLTQWGFTMARTLVTNRPLTQQQIDVGIHQLQAECIQKGLPIEGVMLQYNDATFSKCCGTFGYPGSDRIFWSCIDTANAMQKAA